MPFTEYRLCNGDIVTFKTSSWVFAPSEGADIANDYVFQVEDLDRIFSTRALYSQERSQPSARGPHEDVIDLSVSINACKPQFCTINYPNDLTLLPVLITQNT